MSTLAILICTLPERANKLQRLLSILKPQIARYPDQVFYSIHDAGPAMPTGSKRNALIAQTQSDYFCFIDDDDIISEKYVALILNAMRNNPDVITFNGWMTTNGKDRRNWTIKLGSKYEERDGHYYRWPNHLSVMRRASVGSVRFPDIWQQEDYLWSKKIKDLNLLRTEIHIDQDLYHYDCYTRPSQKVTHRRR